MMMFSSPRLWRLIVPAAVVMCLPLGTHAQQVISPNQPGTQRRTGRRTRTRTNYPQPSVNPALLAPSMPAQFPNGGRRGRGRRRTPSGPAVEFVPGGTVSSAPIVGANGLVYLASWNSRVYALDASTGALKWKFSAPRMFNASPALGADGTVYAGAYDGKVYALDGGDRRSEVDIRVARFGECRTGCQCIRRHGICGRI